MSNSVADIALLDHIANCIERIREYTANSQDKFESSHLVQDAVVRNLQTLAESTQRLSPSLKETESSVPWRKIAGFRNVLAHDYLQVDLAVVWSVIERDLPELSAAIERMIHRATNKGP